MCARSSRFSGALVLAVALAACAPFSGATASAAGAPAQNEPSAATQAAALVARWRIIVAERFEQSRAVKSESIDELFDQFTSVGAVRAIKDKASAEQLREADSTVDRFARLTIQAGVKSGDGSVEVSESSVMTAVKHICPVYPFC